MAKGTELQPQRGFSIAGDLIMHVRIGGIALLLMLSSAFAAERQDASGIRKTVETFLRQETTGLPGEVGVQVGAVDERLGLAPCAQLQPFVPPGARLWGNTTVGVRCIGANAWTVYVPVQIKVTGTYLTAARPLSQGQVLGPDDLVARTGELTQMPAGVLLQPAQALGKAMTSGISGGEPLRADMLRAPTILQSNQPVKVLAKGPGFVVSAEGRALNNAADGQTVQVRVASGQVIAGIVRQGPVVELSN
jgi:flagella basal body P-ring formation protein FlgA